MLPSSDRMLKIPKIDEVLVGELTERGEWIVANIQTGRGWSGVGTKSYIPETLFGSYGLWTGTTRRLP